MASLMESYEQQYSNLTAEITCKTGQIPNLSGSEKAQASSHVERLMDETKELLEQMQLEAHELDPANRQKYTTRLRSYQTELGKLTADLKRARIAFTDHMRAREELLGGEDNGVARSSDQRARLLDNTEQLERSGKRLDHGYKTVLETEEIGNSILDDLHTQRETLQKSRDRLRDTNDMLGKSSRILSQMTRRILQNRVILVVIGILMVVIITVAIYFASVRRS